MEETSLVAVLTPTYNRCAELPRLFESLSTQVDKRFCWYVVDDGSLDETAELLERFRDEANFSIVVMSKPNGGKHTAINFALERITEPFLFIVDSDDFLPSDSIRIVLEELQKLDDRPDRHLFCGVSFLKDMGNASDASSFPHDYLEGTYAEVRINMDVRGDKAEVWRTRCLREIPFPVFEGERFYHEDGVWIRLSASYKMLHINKVIYEGDYLQGGLTKSGRATKMASPRGMCDRSKAFLQYPDHLVLSVKVKHALLWNVYSAVAKERGAVVGPMPDRVLCSLTYFPSIALRCIWAWKARSQNRSSLQVN